MSQAESSKTKKPTKKELEEEVYILRGRMEDLAAMNENLTREIETIGKKEETPEVMEIKREIPSGGIRNLNLNFEEYENYKGLISQLNYYITQKMKNYESIEEDFVREILSNIRRYEETFISRNSGIFDLIDMYNNLMIREDLNFDEFFNFMSNIEINTLNFKALPNINPETLKRNELVKKTLPGSNSVIFTKVEQKNKSSYDSIIGDYIRIDINNSVPCKLRLNLNNPQNAFKVTQGGKEYLFNNIENAKNFCLSGGYQADFITSNQIKDYEKKYKNQYAQSYILR